MRQNIQFEKIDVKKQPRLKQTALVFLGILMLAVLSFFTAISVYAYFTSTATKTGELTFGTIEVKLLNGESEYTVDEFETQYLPDLMPGSTINLNDVTVKNTGTHNAYVLLNLDISIPSKDNNANKLLHYNKWYNVAGEEVNTTNMVINETKPTLISAGSSVTSNIKWTIPGDVVGNDYKTSTATVNLSVYGTQTNLKEAKAYVDPELYATYYLCSNASEIATDNGTTYLGAEITQDPLRKIVTGKNLVDGKFVMGIIDADTGVFTSKTTAVSIVTENYIPIKPNTTYTMTNPIVNKLHKLRFYDIEKNYLGYALASGRWLAYSGSENLIGTGTTPENAYYVRFELDFDDASIGQAVIDGTYKYQLEEGSTATTYEEYSAVEDTFDFNTKTLTRNVGKFEFDGTEAWSTYSYGEEGLSFRQSVLTDKTLGYSMSYCSHFKNVDHAWGTGYTGQTGIYSDHPDNNTQYFRAPQGRTDIDTLAEWKAWLAEQYANGTPVTVWYVSSATTEDKQSTILTSKNLYNSSQRLKYETGASDNTTDELANIISITKDADVNLSKKEQELGGELYDYLYDKNFTLSFKLKVHEQDNAVHPTISVGWFNGDTWVKSSIAITYTVNKGIWETKFYMIPSVSSQSSANINRIRIWLSNNVEFTYRHFEIKDIQIEVGTAPTSFERYDPTEYKRVNGVALRKIGDVKDTYDVTTKKITRNIGELILTGNENWTTSGAVNSVYRYNLNFSGLKPGWFNGVCSHFKMSSENDNFANINEVCFTTHPSSSDFGFFVNSGNKESWINYLKAENSKGNPVKVWYVLKTSKTEQLT